MLCPHATCGGTCMHVYVLCDLGPCAGSSRGQQKLAKQSYILLENNTPMPTSSWRHLRRWTVVGHVYMYCMIWAPVRVHPRGPTKTGETSLIYCWQLIQLCVRASVTAMPTSLWRHLRRCTVVGHVYNYVLYDLGPC